MEVKRFSDVPEVFKVVFRRDYEMSNMEISFDEWLEEQGFEPGTYQHLSRNVGNSIKVTE